MFTDIPLRFESRYDLDLLSEGVKFNLIRLLVDIDFKIPNGWSSKYQAIIDTGSPANIIPKFIWTQTENHFILTKKLSLSGIGSATVYGYLGQVTIRISYRESSSAPLKLRAFLLETDAAPLILGFEDFLTAGKLISDYPERLASIKL